LALVRILFAVKLERHAEGDPPSCRTRDSQAGRFGSPTGGAEHPSGFYAIAVFVQTIPESWCV